MDISGVSSSLMQHIANGATQTGDAVSISVMKKALDIQAQQSAELIASVQQTAPAPQQKASVVGGSIDTYA